MLVIEILINQQNNDLKTFRKKAKVILYLKVFIMIRKYITKCIVIRQMIPNNTNNEGKNYEPKYEKKVLAYKSY